MTSDISIVQMLGEAGTEPDGQDATGLTPLMLASEGGYDETSCLQKMQSAIRLRANESRSDNRYPEAPSSWRTTKRRSLR
ncbi:hypothetical protein NFJ02_32g81190 [Pycnococcus provasolii]